MTITRETQKFDVFYEVPNGGGFTVAPDGIGRYWYDTYQEATEDVGSPLTIVNLYEIPED